ncbi:unnamed protein product [Arabis nemorensis]|uniref:RRM domain-containing protein n=1 Tax=Arabis nemorensis TaxID=586526 RepID=A0A565CVH5_9BRAS|nr:unnamed protein product [Arabis nemorensis]
MAFLSKFGNILKQTTSKQLNAQVSLSSPSLLQAIRCMSSSKLFIGGMAYSMDEDSLREAFNKYGEVVDSNVYVLTQLGLFRIVKLVGRGDLDLLHSPLQKRPLVLSRLWMASANAGAVGGYNGSTGYGSGNTYGSSNGGFAGDNQFGGNQVVGNSSQFGGDNTQFGVGGQSGGEAQFGGSIENNESSMENGSVGGDFEDDTDVAKRA